MPKWKIVKQYPPGEDEIPAVVELVRDEGFTDEQVGEVWHEASVKWDGCADIHRYFNCPKGKGKPDEETTSDYHACGLVDFIDDLLQIEALTRDIRRGDDPETVDTMLARHGYRKFDPWAVGP